jgi:RNA polymerase sigma-70 factor (ECF subfamily)
MALRDLDVDGLIEMASRGDASACQQLLARHRDRLKAMVAVRMDRRLFPRLDPSDVVQEALADAWAKLPEYLSERPIPFYPWLRQLAWKKLVDLHRKHVGAQARSVRREAHLDLALPDRSGAELAERLAASGTSPSRRAIREEVRLRVKGLLDGLPANDREVLVLRYLEHLSTAEIAAVLGIGEGAVKMRHLRALERLREVLDGESS